MQPMSFSWRIQIRYYSPVGSEEIIAMSQNAPLAANPETGASFTACANCHSPMPSELRFCRNCGYRLAEGSAEYTETVRLQDVAYVNSVGNGATAFPGSSGRMTSAAAGRIERRKKRFGGISWIFIAVMMFFIVGGVASYLPSRFHRPGGGSVFSPPPRSSYVGVSGFETTDGGVTFDDVEPPGGPADKAGLVGGDVITTFDGQPIHSDGEMMDRLAETPVGKPVDVVFIRDGETKTTKLTTIAKADFDQLVNAFRHRPEGQGQLGIDDWKRVEMPGTKLHGVRLTVSQNSPADIAGLKTGDVVIAFGGTPIRTSEELVARIHRALPYSTVTVAIMRDGDRLEIPVKIGRH